MISGDVLFDAGNGGELMLNALDANAGHGNARQGIEQHAAKRIAQRLAKTTLKRIDDELAVSVALTDFHTFNFGFFYLIDHSAYPPLHRESGLKPLLAVLDLCTQRLSIYPT